MNYHQTMNMISTCFTTADRLGAKIPKTLDDERMDLLDLATKVRELDVSFDISEAVVAALEAGRDVATDEGVRAAVAGLSIANARNGIEGAVGARAADFLLKNIDDILGLFAGPFSRAAESVTLAAERFGTASLDDTAAILARGGDAAQVWAAAQEATAVIITIRQTWKQLSTVTPRVSVNPRYALLMIADVPPRDFVEDGINAWMTPIEAAQKGYPLSYATPSVLQDRIAAVEGRRAARATEGVERSQAAIRARYGSPVAL